MKKLTKKLASIGLASLLVALCGCQQSPQNSAVVSKNDGAFDENVIKVVTEPGHSGIITEEKREDVFYSTDGTVEFRIAVAVGEYEESRNYPVVEVVPHYLSENDVKRVAKVLFEDAELYEAEPALYPTYSQAELREKIERWSHFTNEQAASELLGSTNNSQETVALVKQFVENYTEMYDSAPVQDQRELCEWKFHKSSYYQVSSAEFMTRNTENENDTIAATVQRGNIHYYFDASTRDKKDFKLNNISAYLYDGIGPDMIDERIFRAWLCRTAPPTDEQVANIKKKAEEMLKQMQLGEWLVDECYVESTYYGDIAEYIVRINAVPILNGIPAIRVPQLTNLKSEETYASSYYITDAKFEFSPNGELIAFQLYSPIDIVNIVNDSVAVKSNNELMAAAKNYLELSDYYEYGFGPVVDLLDEEVNCKVNITELERNLTRVKVPNSDESYYYVPAIAFKGSVEYINPISKEVYFSSDDVTLVTINAVDGTVIMGN